jgi:carboxypeptidase Taq
MADALEQVKSRLADWHALGQLSWLLNWDQQVMMPAAGAHHRADHLSLLQRLSHEMLVDPELGRLLDEVGELDPETDDGALVRLARRDRTKILRVPAELTAEMARCAAEAQSVWREAKATSNFELFLPVLEKQIELRRRYVDYVDPDADEPYDVLLDDFEPEMRSADVARIFDEIKQELVPLIAELREREVDQSFLYGEFPVEQQVALSNEVIDLFGHRPDSWRLDPTVHPFAAGAGIDDIRITTYYFEDELKSLFATMHEYGHGLYEHQLPRHLAHLPVGSHASLAMHESQSRLWENLVGRSMPFWRFFYPRLQTSFPDQFGEVELERFYAGVNRVKPGLIRIEADEVTYGMHVILRFELELDILHGRVDLSELPRVWNERMEQYLGVEVPDDAHGVLQDVHWASGLIGYFSTYLLGTVMSVQLWEKANEAVPDLEEQIERGEFSALRGWLGENLHALGRRYPPQEALRRATGSTIDAKPYLAYLKRKYGAPVAA